MSLPRSRTANIASKGPSAQASPAGVCVGGGPARGGREGPRSGRRRRLLLDLTIGAFGNGAAFWRPFRGLFSAVATPISATKSNTLKALQDYLYIIPD